MRPALLAMFGLIALSGALGACGDDEPAPPDATAPVPPDATADATAPVPPDATPPVPPDAMPGCRSSDECTGNGVLCLGPNQPNCGIPPREECSDDQGCGAEQRCHAVADGCSPDGVGATCGPACTPGDASCGEGFACDDGNCVALGCDEGFTCRASETCDPSVIVDDAPVADRHHGCQSIPCADDDACPADTLCVNGICQDGPGTCTLPAP